jgi:hypothetical protein
VLIVAVCSNVDAAYAQTQLNSQTQYFDLVEEVKISTETIAGIWTLDKMDQAGNILLKSSQVEHYLYQRRTGNVIKLDSEQCRPGHKARLVESHFTPDGEIFATDYMFLFWFNKEGKCLAYSSDKVILGSFTVPIPGRRVAFIRDHHEPNEIHIIDKDGKIAKSNTLKALPNQHLAYRFEGGGFNYVNGYLYWTTSMSPEIAVFDLDLNEVKRVPIPFETMEYPTQDITLQERENLSFQERIDISKRLEGFSRTVSFGYHGENTFVIYAGRNKPKQGEMLWFDTNFKVTRNIQSDDILFRVFENVPYFYTLKVENEYQMLRIYRVKQ